MRAVARPIPVAAPVMTKVFPTYARYQKGTDREIPVVVIERAP